MPLKETILLVFYLFLLSSCSGKTIDKNNNEQNAREVKWDERYLRKISNDSLKYYTYEVEQDSVIQKTKFGKSIELPTKWVRISRNALGFFIYRRSSSRTGDLILERDTLRDVTLMETHLWPIGTFKKLNDTKYYLGLGDDTISSVYARSTFEIIDPDTLYTILNIEVFKMDGKEEKLLGHYTSLYVPAHKQHLFPHIDEPNTKSPDSWIPNEEIDMEAFKRRKITEKRLGALANTK